MNVRLRHGKLNSFFCKRLPQSNASIQPNGKEHEKCSHVWGARILTLGTDQIGQRWSYLRFEKHLLITEAAGTLGVGEKAFFSIFRSQSILNFDQKSISHQSHWVIFDDQRLALKSFSWLLKHQAELCDVVGEPVAQKYLFDPQPNSSVFHSKILIWTRSKNEVEKKRSNYHFASKFISVPDRACPLQKLQDKSVAFLFFSFFLIPVLTFFLSPKLHCCLLCPLQNLYCSIPDLN